MTPYHLTARSLLDTRLAYRAECRSCPNVSCWHPDRAVAERIGRLHQEYAHQGQERNAL